jgi:hypothetical protein
MRRPSAAKMAAASPAAPRAHDCDVTSGFHVSRDGILEAAPLFDTGKANPNLSIRFHRRYNAVTLSGPEFYVEWMNQHPGFNPRAQQNSNALSGFVIADLCAVSPLIQAALASGLLHEKKNAEVYTKVVSRKRRSRSAYWRGHGDLGRYIGRKQDHHGGAWQGPEESFW